MSDELKDYLIAVENRSRLLNNYIWYFFAVCFILGVGYIAGMYQGYHQALVDFEIIKGIALPL